LSLLLFSAFLNIQDKVFKSFLMKKCSACQMFLQGKEMPLAGKRHQTQIEFQDALKKKVVSLQRAIMALFIFYSLSTTILFT